MALLFSFSGYSYARGQQEGRLEAATSNDYPLKQQTLTIESSDGEKSSIDYDQMLAKIDSLEMDRTELLSLLEEAEGIILDLQTNRDDYKRMTEELQQSVNNYKRWNNALVLTAVGAAVLGCIAVTVVCVTRK